MSYFYPLKLKSKYFNHTEMRKARRITNIEVYKIIKHIYNIKENISLIVKCNVYI